MPKTIRPSLLAISQAAALALTWRLAAAAAAKQLTPRLLQGTGVASDTGEPGASVVALGDISDAKLRSVLKPAEYNVPAQRFGLDVGERPCCAMP